MPPKNGKVDVITGGYGSAPVAVPVAASAPPKPVGKTVTAVSGGGASVPIAVGSGYSGGYGSVPVAAPVAPKPVGKTVTVVSGGAITGGSGMDSGSATANKSSDRIQDIGVTRNLITSHIAVIIPSSVGTTGGGTASGGDEGAGRGGSGGGAGGAGGRGGGGAGGAGGAGGRGGGGRGKGRGKGTVSSDAGGGSGSGMVTPVIPFVEDKYQKIINDRFFSFINRMKSVDEAKNGTNNDIKNFFSDNIQINTILPGTDINSVKLTGGGRTISLGQIGLKNTVYQQITDIFNKSTFEIITNANIISFALYYFICYGTVICMYAIQTSENSLRNSTDKTTISTATSAFEQKIINIFTNIKNQLINDFTNFNTTKNSTNRNALQISLERTFNDVKDILQQANDITRQITEIQKKNAVIISALQEIEKTTGKPTYQNKSVAFAALTGFKSGFSPNSVTAVQNIITELITDITGVSFPFTSPFSTDNNIVEKALEKADAAVTIAAGAVVGGGGGGGGAAAPTNRLIAILTAVNTEVGDITQTEYDDLVKQIAVEKAVISARDAYNNLSFQKTQYDSLPRKGVDDLKFVFYKSNTAIKKFNSAYRTIKNVYDTTGVPNGTSQSLIIKLITSFLQLKTDIENASTSIDTFSNSINTAKKSDTTTNLKTAENDFTAFFNDITTVSNSVTSVIIDFSNVYGVNVLETIPYDLFSVINNSNISLQNMKLIEFKQIFTDFRKIRSDLEIDGFVAKEYASIQNTFEQKIKSKFDIVRDIYQKIRKKIGNTLSQNIFLAQNIKDSTQAFIDKAKTSIENKDTVPNIKSDAKNEATKIIKNKYKNIFETVISLLDQAIDDWASNFQFMYISLVYTGIIVKKTVDVFLIKKTFEQLLFDEENVIAKYVKEKNLIDTTGTRTDETTPKNELLTKLQKLKNGILNGVLSVLEPESQRILSSSFSEIEKKVTEIKDDNTLKFSDLYDYITKDETVLKYANSMFAESNELSKIKVPSNFKREIYKEKIQEFKKFAKILFIRADFSFDEKSVEEATKTNILFSSIDILFSSIEENEDKKNFLFFFEKTKAQIKALSKALKQAPQPEFLKEPINSLKTANSTAVFSAWESFYQTINNKRSLKTAVKKSYKIANTVLDTSLKQIQSDYNSDFITYIAASTALIVPDFALAIGAIIAATGDGYNTEIRQEYIDVVPALDASFTLIDIIPSTQPGFLGKDVKTKHKEILQAVLSNSSRFDLNAKNVAVIATFCLAVTSLLISEFEKDEVDALFKDPAFYSRFNKTRYFAKDFTQHFKTIFSRFDNEKFYLKKRCIEVAKAAVEAVFVGLKIEKPVKSYNFKFEEEKSKELFVQTTITLNPFAPSNRELITELSKGEKLGLNRTMKMTSPAFVVQSPENERKRTDKKMVKEVDNRTGQKKTRKTVKSPVIKKEELHNN